MEDDTTVGHATVDKLSLKQLRRAVIDTVHTDLHRAVDARIKKLSRIEDHQETLKFIERLREETTNNVLYHEADDGAVMSEGPASSARMVQEQNVVDISGNEEHKTSAGINRPVVDNGISEALNMGDFLSRPIRLMNNTIIMGTDYDFVIDVWDKFFLEPSVRAKIKNYAYFRGDAMVKIVLTGTPFHCGRLLISYQPYRHFNETLTSYATANGFTTDLRNNYLGYLSQAPGSCTMDLKENVPLVVKCPFISTKPMHRLFNSSTSAIAANTSLTDMYNAGSLYISTLNTPNSVSDDAPKVSIAVYGWMENVQLGTNTGTVLALTTEGDEYEVGPVEEISTKIADVAGVLTKIPEISPYAYATKMLFTGISKWAALYGWSKPPVENKPMFVKNMPYTNGSYVIGYESTHKLSLDPKQELALAPQVCGVSSDDMTLHSICKRESYWWHFRWQPTDVNTSVLFQALVSPWTVSTATHGTTLRTFVQPTALAFAAQPFAYWRGDIEYRFDFVCSSFHRGKVAIFYEPNIWHYSLVSAQSIYNKQFMTMVDLQETQSVVVRVNWASPRAWLKVGCDLTNTFEKLYNGTPISGDYFNGIIYVMPITQLTSPNNLAIDVNVFISSPNMQFNYLIDDVLPQERKIVTEGLLWHEADVGTEFGHTVIDLNKSSAKTDHLSEEYFGENPISFRLLLKRFAPVNTTTVTTTTGTFHTLQLTLFNMPQPGSIYSTAPVAAAMNNIYSYLRYAYLGMRGGIRHRLRHVVSVQTSNSNFAVVSNLGPETFATETYTESTSAVPYISQKGSAIYVFANNAGVEYETPFYSNNLFVFSFSSTLDGGQNTTDLDMETAWVRRHIYQTNGNVASTTMYFSRDMATGEDFDMIRFGGAPYYSRLGS